jgi:lysozyme
LLGWIAREEGFRARPYRCTEGYLTVGYGLNLDAGITEPEAALILGHRVRRLQDEVAVALPWWGRLDEVRRGCLVAMAYQLKGGVQGLLKCRATLAAVQRGDWDAAARQMLRSRWAQQTPARARRTAEAMRTGRWPVEG